MFKQNHYLWRAFTPLLALFSNEIDEVLSPLYQKAVTRTRSQGKILDHS